MPYVYGDVAMFWYLRRRLCSGVCRCTALHSRFVLCALLRPAHTDIAQPYCLLPGPYLHQTAVVISSATGALPLDTHNKGPGTELDRARFTDKGCSDRALNRILEFVVAGDSDFIAGPAR